MKKLIALATTLATMLILGGSAAAAGTAALSLSPASGSYNTGSTVSVGVYENGANVNVVTVSLSFDASKLQFVGASCGGAFPNTVIAASSTPKFTCSVTPGSPAVSGNAGVGSVSFKAVAAGTTSVSFAADSQVASNGVNAWDGSPSGGTYTLTTPAPVVAPPVTHPKVAPKPSQTSAVQGAATSAPATTTPAATPTPKSTPVVAKTKPVVIAKASGFEFSSALLIAILLILAVAFVVGMYYEKILAFFKANTKPTQSKAKTIAKKPRKPSVA